MASLADLTMLNRAVDDLEERIAAARRGRIADADRRLLRSEVERVMQRLKPASRRGVK